MHLKNLWHRPSRDNINIVKCNNNMIDIDETEQSAKSIQQIELALAAKFINHPRKVSSVDYNRPEYQIQIS